MCTRAHTHTHTRSQSQSPLLPRSSKGFCDLQRGEAVGIPSSFCYKSHTRPRIPEPPTLVLRVCLAHRCVRVRVRVTINAQAERSPLCGPGRVCGPVTHHALVRQHVWGVGVRVCEGEQREQGKHTSWHEQQAAPRILSNASAEQTLKTCDLREGGGKKQKGKS